MARAYEMHLAVVVCARAAEVRARDREGTELSLVAGQVAGECRIAGGIPLTAIGHDEGHPGRRLEARDPALMQRIHRRVERNADLVLRLVWITRRKDVNRKRCHHGDYRGGQYRRHPPAKKSSPGGISRLLPFQAHCASNYVFALQASTRRGIRLRTARSGRRSRARGSAASSRVIL